MEQRQADDRLTEKTEKAKSRLGLFMIAFYTIVYFAFIIIAVLNPQLMGKSVGSINVAILYGFGIIILAIIQALIYNYMCSKREKEDELSEIKEKTD